MLQPGVWEQCAAPESKHPQGISRAQMFVSALLWKGARRALLQVSDCCHSTFVQGTGCLCRAHWEFLAEERKFLLGLTGNCEKNDPELFLVQEKKIIYTHKKYIMNLYWIYFIILCILYIFVFLIYLLYVYRNIFL